MYFKKEVKSTQDQITILGIIESVGYNQTSTKLVSI